MQGGLGIHFRLDLVGRTRFSPDVQWVDSYDCAVDPTRAESFYPAIRTYWPGLPDGTLVPNYSGIRPKLTGPGEPAADFMIDTPADHDVPRLVNLFGIESPGLRHPCRSRKKAVAKLTARPALSVRSIRSSSV